MWTIKWHLFLKVSERRKADKLLSKVIEKIKLPSSIISVEKYWKDDKLFEAHIESNLNVEKTMLPELVFSVLNIASKVAERWTIIPLKIYENDNYSFSGYAQEKDIKIVGIQDVSFLTLNYEE